MINLLKVYIFIP